jgi:uncharacterized protein (DUF58 family)
MEILKSVTDITKAMNDSSSSSSGTRFAKLKKFVPFTGRGIFFLLLASGLFTLGVIRADLASLFWGCGFLALVFYSLIGNKILNGIVRRYLVRHPDSLDITIPRDGVFPGQYVSGDIKAMLPGFFIPGFSLTLRLVFSFPARKPIRISQTLAPGKNKASFSIATEHRGIYRLRDAVFAVEDLLGFTESGVESELEEYVKVFPSPLDKETVLSRIASDESTDTMKKKRISDELLEVKKYYPGDDIRRLNWKVFAHTGELFVRKGEETPPPDVKLLFIIDPALPESLPDGIRADYLDSLIESSATLALAALDAGNPVILSIPGSGEPRVFERRAKNDLLTLLSDIVWQEEPGKLELPGKRHLHGVVFSSPRSPAIPGIVNALRERNWEMSLFLKNFIFPSHTKKAFDFAKLVFVGRSGLEKENTSPWEIIAFKQTLYSEIAKYRQEPWRVADVREF